MNHDRESCSPDLPGIPDVSELVERDICFRLPAWNEDGDQTRSIRELEFESVLDGEPLGEMSELFELAKIVIEFGSIFDLLFAIVESVRTPDMLISRDRERFHRPLPS